MNRLVVTFFIFALISCNSQQQKHLELNNQNLDLATLAFEGINIDFEFNSKKPSFGDLFLIVGFENPNFPPSSKEFEKIVGLGFEQVDDYFGIRNYSDEGDDIKLWLFPVVNGEYVFHHHGPFDAIRVSYGVLGNDQKTAELFENSFNVVTSNLDVTPTFDGKQIQSFEEIRSVIAQTTEYCRDILKVEPGSDEALQLDW